MKTTEAVKGRGWEVLAHYGFQATHNKHVDCPLCNKKKSFRLHEYNGAPSWICVCGSGDMFSLLMQVTGKQFKDVCKEIDEILGITYERTELKPRRNWEAEFVEKWKAMPRVNDVPSIIAYLRSRGIFTIPRRAMKAQVRNGREIMTCVASTDLGRPVIEHQTLLENGKKAKVENAKLTYKIDKEREIHESIAIRLFEPATCLGIAEGIETALSAHQLYECNVWAVINSGFMKKFRAPAGVEHLIIFADSDANGTGHAAAFECARANMLANNNVKRVTVRWIDSGDFNDLLQMNQAVHEWIFK